MNHYDDMQKIIDYIEEHLDEELCIDRLSEMAVLSKFYFQRLFYKLVGVTVMEYVRLRRVARASDEIKECNNITDVAFNYGFNNVETFIRSFKAIYKMTPTEYKKSNIPLAHFYKTDLSLKYRYADIGVPLITSGIVLEINTKEITDDIKLVGTLKECSMEPAGQDNPSIAWSDYNAIRDSISKDCTPHVEYGISLPSEITGKFNYLAAKQVQEFCDEHRQYDQFTIPSGFFAVCTFSGEDFYQLTNAALDKAFAYFLQTWLPNSDYEMTGYYAAEVYDCRSLKDHPLPEQVQRAPKDMIMNPPEMDIIVSVKRKEK
ncbi:AraC family transcriptional regulator [Vallitalea okinawensis]|uniref:AraC family transcriptional regulator n=1 Tax=Vallitalea okinawensis TaxID=2078660 RepID=UPI000CFAFEE4|nr:helix-turn-helix domain-containing protein [Vallitalea okinawensis]